MQKAASQANQPLARALQCSRWLTVESACKSYAPSAASARAPRICALNCLCFGSRERSTQAVLGLQGFVSELRRPWEKKIICPFAQDRLLQLRWDQNWQATVGASSYEGGWITFGDPSPPLTVVNGEARFTDLTKVAKRGRTDSTRHSTEILMGSVAVASQGLPVVVVFIKRSADLGLFVSLG